MKPFLNWLDGVPTRYANIIFWTSLSAVLAALIAPLWVGTITPLTDFGGHLQMVDAFVRGDALPALDSRVTPREGWLVPNLLPAHLANALYPWVTPNESLRLFLTLILLNLATAFLLCCREFNRPRSLIFLGLPFFWGGMTGLGLINYIGIYPLLLYALSLARMVAHEGRKRDSFALVCVTSLAFFMHGVGFLFVLGLSGLSLLIALPQRRYLWRFLTLLPSLGMWLFWFLNGPLSSPGSGGLTSATERIRIQPLSEKLSAFHGDALDVLVGTADDIALVLLLLTLAAWFLGQSHPRPPDASKLEFLRNRPVLILWSTSLLSVLVMPTYVGTILIDTRMITPTMMLLCILPRPLVSRGLMRLLGAATVLISVGFGLSLSVAADLYDEREIKPLSVVIESLPSGSRAECVQVGRVNTVFKRRPLSHNCNALLQTQRDAFAGAGFAYTRFNAIEFKPGESYHSLRRGDWQRSRARRHWDFIVVRGAHKPPPGVNLKKIRISDSSHPLGTSWTLYKILR